MQNPQGQRAAGARRKISLAGDELRACGQASIHWVQGLCQGLGVEELQEQQKSKKQHLS